MPEAPSENTAEKAVARLLELVGTGRIDEVRAILKASPRLVNAVGPHPFWGGRPQPLHVAIETKRRDVFDLLLDSGADPNGTNDAYEHWSPLMLAVNEDEMEMRDELLRRGATVGLLEALMFGDDDAVEGHLKPGRSALPGFAPNGGSILAYARTTQAIDRLLELGASPDARDRWGATPIEAMSRRGARGRALVAHMVARGIPAAPQEYARLGDHERLAALIEADPLVASADAVVMGAVDFGHHDLAFWLFARGANANARSGAPSRHTALHSAAWNGDLRMAEILVAAGADPALRDEQYHATALGWARTSVEVSNNPKCAEVAAYLEGLDGTAEV